MKVYFFNDDFIHFGLSSADGRIDIRLSGFYLLAHTERYSLVTGAER